MRFEKLSETEEQNNISKRHVVLVGPEIHWNTGNIGRTCLGVGAFLHLIEPIGFSIDSKHVKRAGLDYWHKVRYRVWNDFDEFSETMFLLPEEVALFAKTGQKDFRSMPSRERMFLIFGSETGGLPEKIRRQFPECSYYIPISDEIRCLNLSTAVGIALYESIRNFNIFHGWKS